LEEGDLTITSVAAPTVVKEAEEELIEEEAAEEAVEAEQKAESTEE
jgi:hypothetical protein